MADPSDRWQALGKRVGRRREELGFRQVDVQKTSNLSDVVVRDIEKGRRRSEASCRKLSLGLGWTLDSIGQFLRDGREPVDIEVALERLRAEHLVAQAALAYAITDEDDRDIERATAEVERLEGEIRILSPLVENWIEKRDAVRQAQPKLTELERRVSSLEREVENIKDRLDNYDPFDS
jgi:transcriptional regulator with XRE-family HTH domain